MTPLRRSFGRLRASLAASRPPPMAAPRQGVAPPDPREGKPSPLRPERPAAAPLPICRPGGKGKRSAQAEGRRAVWLLGEIFKKAPQGREAGRGLGGRAPPGSGAVVNACAGGGRSGVNAQRCPRRPRAAALSTAERATGRSGRGCLAVPHSAYYVQSEKQQAAKPRKT